MGIELYLRERAAAITTMLSEPQWRPSRSHVEVLRNYMAEGAAEIERLRSAMDGARTAIVAASVASCTCLTMTPDASHHAADCRYAKLAFALDCLDIEEQSSPQKQEA